MANLMRPGPAGGAAASSARAASNRRSARTSGKSASACIATSIRSNLLLPTLPVAATPLLLLLLPAVLLLALAASAAKLLPLPDAAPGAAAALTAAGVVGSTLRPASAGSAGSAGSPRTISALCTGKQAGERAGWHLASSYDPGLSQRSSAKGCTLGGLARHRPSRHCRVKGLAICGRERAGPALSVPRRRGGAPPAGREPGQRCPHRCPRCLAAAQRSAGRERVCARGRGGRVWAGRRHAGWRAGQKQQAGRRASRQAGWQAWAATHQAASKVEARGAALRHGGQQGADRSKARVNRDVWFCCRGSQICQELLIRAAVLRLGGTTCNGAACCRLGAGACWGGTNRRAAVSSRAASSRRRAAAAAAAACCCCFSRCSGRRCRGRRRSGGGGSGWGEVEGGVEAGGCSPWCVGCRRRFNGLRVYCLLCWLQQANIQGPLQHEH